LVSLLLLLPLPDLFEGSSDQHYINYTTGNFDGSESSPSLGKCFQDGFCCVKHLCVNYLVVLGHVFSPSQQLAAFAEGSP
jgi:hypothetical protein